MRAAMVCLCLFATATAFGGETIEQVLERSQRTQLQALEHVDEQDGRVAVIRASYERLLAGERGPQTGTELRVVEGPMVAACMFGRVIVAHVSLAEVPESERLFVLAHELGHVAHGHWAHFTSIYRKHVPGDVTQELTDAAAVRLGPEMSELAHAHELDADAYGLRALHRFGLGIDTVLASSMRYGVRHDSATHPGTRKRLSHLRTIEDQ